jgi:hypothetical protein
MGNEQRNTFIGAGMVVALGAVIAVYAAGTEDEEDGSTGCLLTGTGVAAIAQGLTKNRSPAVIAGGLGVGGLAGAACERAVKDLAEKPAQPVPLTVQTADGTTTYEVTGQELTAEPAPPAPDLTHSLRCFRYEWELLRQMCLDGEVEPL